MKISPEIAECRKKMLQHLNRIQGQINTLKQYIDDDVDCSDIALLTTSIAKSFDSVRAKTLESFILNDLLHNSTISEDKKTKLEEILKLYKK